MDPSGFRNIGLCYVATPEDIATCDRFIATRSRGQPMLRTGMVVNLRGCLRERMDESEHSARTLADISVSGAPVQAKPRQLCCSPKASLLSLRYTPAIMQCRQRCSSRSACSVAPAFRTIRRVQPALNVRPVQASSVSTSSIDLLSVDQQRQIGTFVDFLLEENSKYNLTAVRDRDEAFTRHVLDSLALLEVIEGNLTEELAQNLSIIDVGSGPGLPGCILGIARPNWTVRSCTWANRTTRLNNTIQSTFCLGATQYL